MDLAESLQPVEQHRGVGVDPVDLGGLVGHADFDQLVQVLIDAAFQQFDQPLPGDVRAPAAAQLLDLGELIQGVLILALDGVQPVELGGFLLALLRPDHGELALGQLFKLGEIGVDDFVQIRRSERPVGHADQERVGPGLEQLLTVAGKLQLALQLLVGDAGAGQVTMGFRHAPIGKPRRRKRHGEQQGRRDEELGPIAHCLASSSP